MPREGLAASQLLQHTGVMSGAHPAQALAGREEFLLTEPRRKTSDLSTLALLTGSIEKLSLFPNIGKLWNLLAPGFLVCSRTKWLWR